ncbi:hypothetical protein ACFSKW_35340 [Nonomuraea mangrovi]|uniref:Uncharacterized protein n=1 Tax=Nonomuraea mangrovi TaxID=2316207 RepID=A0ABW4T4Z8_9ACTN
MARTKLATRHRTQRRTAEQERSDTVRPFVSGRVVDSGRMREALQASLRPGGRAALEGDDRKHGRPGSTKGSPSPRR